MIAASYHFESLESRRHLSSAPPAIVQTNLVSNLPDVAQHQDANLVNAWGLAPNIGNGVIWTSNNGTGTSTLFDTTTNSVLSLAVNVPGAPTGVVVNGGKGFAVTKDGNSGPARFIYVSEDGTISGWNQNVDVNNAIVAVNNSGSGAIYKGVALAKMGSKQVLYVANFHDGTIEEYDKNFNKVATTGFVDPNLPDGFAPFNIQAIGNKLFVAFAKQDADKSDEVAGAGLGAVDVFSSKGKLLNRLTDPQGLLNAPWGMTIAPKTFSAFKGDLLVGNFGDGHINVFSKKGVLVAQLDNAQDQPIVIDGLWGLHTGNGLKSGKNTVFFAAGPDDEANGLLGSLTSTSTIVPPG